MDYFIYCLSAWFHFIVPISVLEIKTNHQQKFLFVISLAGMTAFSRSIYQYISLPYGTHTIIFVVFEILLFKLIIKELSLKKSILIAWVNILIVIISESCIVLPILRYYSMNINTNSLMTLLLGGIGSNLGLMIVWIIGKIRRKREKIKIGM